MTNTPEENEPPASIKEPESSKRRDEHAKNGGGHVRFKDPPANQSASDDQSAALLKAPNLGQPQPYDYRDHNPYLLYSPVNKSRINPFKPVKPVFSMFTTWTRKASDVSQNVWHNLKTGPSVPKAACGKIKVTAKAVSKGGFQSLFKHTFKTEPNEKLIKSFACYLSTTTGPVGGTLYLSTARMGFCSDRPLSLVAPPAQNQRTWFYYKVMIPLANMSTVNPANRMENPLEKYIEIVTVDGHSFWFVGFVNFEKALHNLLDAVSGYRAAEYASRPAAP